MGVNGVLEKLNKLQESLGINIWKFDIEPINAGDIFEMKSFMTMGDFVKDIGRDLAGLVGLQNKVVSNVDSLGGGDGSGDDTGKGEGKGKGKGITFDKSKFNEFLDTISAGAEKAKGKVSSLATSLQDSMTNGAKSAAGGLALFGQGLVTFDSDKMQLFIEQMKQIEEMASPLSALETMAKGLGESFISLAENGATSMADLSKAVISEIRKMIVAKIKLGVTNAIASKMGAGPFGILLAGAAGIAASAIFSRVLGAIKIPALAKGGAAFGPTLAMVGDNPNAMSDPELIMPFSKMKKMILNDIIGNRQGAQEIRLATSAIEIDGRKLRILLEQENNYVRGLR